MKLDISKIKQARLKESQFFAELSLKTQIYLHHTAGGGNAEAVSRYWNGNTERIATAFIIGADGLIVQCFSSKHWAWHLGVGQKEFKAQGVPYTNLNKTSVGIEVCNWGYLKEKNGHFYNYVNARVPDSMVTTLETPYKGYKHWYKYTDAQIESTRQLLVYLCETYDIPKDYRSEIFGLDKEAFKGTPKEFTPIIQFVKTKAISTLVQE
jgi:N-acetyl-anhydromuramyl-L-alanine amidase AmpD